MLQLLNSEALTFGPFIYVILCISLVVVGVEFYSLHRSLKHLRSARKAVESKVQVANCDERFHPPATVIVPCRGLDLELDENVRAILTQHYPRYSVVFVVDSQLDPAYNALRRMVNELPQPLVDVRIVENRMLPKTSGKVSALTAAVDAGVEGEVLVFADSDIRPAQDWLSSLVDPLKDDAVGVSTAYRWCVPAARTFAATFQSAWNAFGTAAFLSSKTVFAWGGSMALRRTVFERLRIRDRWKGEISDDAGVTS
ncbi:MAG: glycosyltransferase, partial [Candidatus Bathyarchaeia archaeon]